MILASQPFEKWTRRRERSLVVRCLAVSGFSRRSVCACACCDDGEVDDFVRMGSDAAAVDAYLAGLDHEARWTDQRTRPFERLVAATLARGLIEATA